MGVVGFARESRAPQLTQNRRGTSASREFLVQVDSRFDGPMLVSLAIGVPRIGHYYAFGGESNSFLFCTRVRPRIKNPKALVWTVECEYETPSAEGNESQQSDFENPTFDLPVISTGSWSEYRDAVKDKDDNPIVNSAGDPFRPHPKREYKWPTLTIQRNEAIDTPIISTQLAFSGKVNTQPFWEGTERAWKCVDITSRMENRVLASGLLIPFLIVTYQFQGRDRWVDEFLDSGWNYLDANGKKRAFINEEGREYEGFLDVDGHKIETPQFIEFPMEPEVDFNALNLPRSYLEGVPF